jgi:integrase/recombinase XerD
MAPKKRTNKTIKTLVPSRHGGAGGLQRMSVESLKTIPEEEVWLAIRKSARTRRAYRTDVAHFMRTFGISTPEELRTVDHRAVMAWERLMREEEGKEATTVRRRLAALSSLFAHLGFP